MNFIKIPKQYFWGALASGGGGMGGATDVAGGAPMGGAQEFTGGQSMTGFEGDITGQSISENNDIGGGGMDSSLSAPKTGQSTGAQGDIYKSGAGGMQGAAEDMGAGTVQMIAGIVQLAEGNKKKQEAVRLFPSLMDPMETSAYSRFRRMSRNASTGTKFSEQMDEILGAQKSTQTGIVRASGGAAGMAVAGLSKANESFGDVFAKVLSEMESTKLQYEALADAKLNRIVDRKKELEMVKYSQKMAEATQQEQEGKSNTLGGLTRSMAGTNSLFANLYGMGG